MFAARRIQEDAAALIWCAWCEAEGIIPFLQDEDAFLSSSAIDKTVEGGIKDIIKMSFIKIER